MQEATRIFRTTALFVALTALLICSLAPGFFGKVLNDDVYLVDLKTVKLDPKDLTPSSEVPGAFEADISLSEHRRYSNNLVVHSGSTAIVLLADSKPLTPYGSLEPLKTGCKGCYHFDENKLWVVPEDSSNVPGTLVLVFPRAKQLSSEQLFRLTRDHLFPICIAVCVIGGFLLRQHLVSRIAFTAIIAFLYFEHLRYDPISSVDDTPAWDFYYVSPDTGSYAAALEPGGFRPLAYPLFLSAVTGLDGRALLSELQKVPSNTPNLGDSTSPFLRVVRAQKLLHWISLTFFAWALMSMVPAPWVAALFLWIIHKGFLPAELPTAISETLAQSLLFLMLGTVSILLSTRKSPLLVAISVLCGCMIATRSAAMYSLSVLGIASVVVVWRDRRQAVRPLVVSALALVLLYVGPSMYRQSVLGGGDSLPQYADSRIAFALQVASREDVALLPEGDMRKFFLDAMDLKDKEDLRLIESMGGRDKTYGFSFLQPNMYRVALQLAGERGYNGSKRSELFLTIAEPILRKNLRKYLSMVAESYSFATTIETHLNFDQYLTFWTLVGTVLVLALISRGPHAVMALACLSAHLTHLLVVAAYDAPIPRYVHATELLVLVALVVGGGGVLSRLDEWVKQYVASRQERLRVGEIAVAEVS